MIEPLKAYTILIVDDELAILNMLRRSLTLEGYAVISASNAEEALRLLETQSIHLIISDQMMPGGMSGTQFLRVVKQTYPDIVTMILSAYAKPNDILDALNEARTSYYLVKPWDDDELIRRVALALLPYHQARMEKERLAHVHALLEKAHVMADIGARAGGMVHNIKNMLFPMAAQLDAIRLDLHDIIQSDLETETHNPLLKKYGNGILEMVDNGEATLADITDFLETALSTFRGKSRTFETFDFSKMIQNNIRLEKARPEFKNIHIQFETDGSDFLMEGLKGYLSSNIVELIKNAGDAISAHCPDQRGTIHMRLESLSLEPWGDCARLSIQDDGGGMSDATKLKIFDHQFTTKGEKGTGLGLSEVMEMIRRHHGTMTVDSVLGEGTTFTIVLPKRQKQTLTDGF